MAEKVYGFCENKCRMEVVPYSEFQEYGKVVDANIKDIEDNQLKQLEQRLSDAIANLESRVSALESK